MQRIILPNQLVEFYQKALFVNTKNKTMFCLALSTFIMLLEIPLTRAADWRFRQHNGEMEVAIQVDETIAEFRIRGRCALNDNPAVIFDFAIPGARRLRLRENQRLPVLVHIDGIPVATPDLVRMVPINSDSQPMVEAGPFSGNAGILEMMLTGRVLTITRGADRIRVPMRGSSAAFSALWSQCMGLASGAPPLSGVSTPRSAPQPSSSLSRGDTRTLISTINARATPNTRSAITFEV